MAQVAAPVAPLLVKQGTLAAWPRLSWMQMERRGRWRSLQRSREEAEHVIEEAERASRKDRGRQEGRQAQAAERLRRAGEQAEVALAKVRKLK